MSFRRYLMLKSYRNDIIKFALINLLCIGIVMLELALNVELTNTLVGGIVFLILILFLAFILSTNIISSRKSFIRRWELLSACIFVFAYTLSPVASARVIVELLVMFSLIYNLGLKLGIGLKIKLRFIELSWFDGGLITK